jgi:small-conductance mechanosensitive channel
MPSACAVLVALLAAAAAVPAPSPATATLAVANRDVVTFRATVAGNGPPERVRVALQRIQALPPAAFEEPVTSQQVSLGDERGFAVLVGRRLVFAVTDGDRDPLGGDEPTERIAADAADRLAEALRAWREQRSVKTLLRGLWQSGVATGVLGLALWMLVLLRRVIQRALSGFAQRGAAKVLRGRIDVAPVVTATVRTVVLVLSWSLVLLLLDVWVVYVLGRFPLTAPWAGVLTRRVLGVLASVGLATLRALPGLVAVAVIFLGARFLAGFLKSVLDRVERGAVAIPGLYPETVPATRRIVVGLVWLVALAVAYPYIPGSDSEAVKGLSLLVGVMLSLGSTGLVAQSMSGLALIYSRALSAGDTVRIGDVEGVVTEVGLLSTKVVTVPGEEVTFPNSVVLGGSVRNYTRLSRGTGPLVTTRVTIGYDAPWRQVHALLLGAAGATRGLAVAPAPFVLQSGFGDFWVEYRLVARLEAEPEERPRVLSDLHAAVQDAFNAAGVQIMSPHFAFQPREPVVVPRERWGGEPAPPGRQRG